MKKLTADDAFAIRVLYAKTETTLGALAKQWKVFPSTIWNVVMNRTWSNPDYEPPIKVPINLTYCKQLRAKHMPYHLIAKEEARYMGRSKPLHVETVRQNLRKAANEQQQQAA